MELFLNEQQTLFADSAAKFAKDRGGPRRARAQRNSGSELDREAWAGVITSGLLTTMVREAHGGLGLGATDLALTVEECGKQLLMIPLVEAGAAAWALSRMGAAAAIQDLLGGAKLIVPATFAESWRFPAAAGPRGMHFSSDAGTLDGEVEPVSFAGSADAFLVDGEAPSRERCLAMVPAARLTINTRRNVDGSTSSRLAAAASSLDAVETQVRGDAAQHIGQRMQELLVLWTSVELLGVAQGALDMTSEYLKLRKQFGKPIGSFQALQHRVVDCFVDLELNRSLVYRVLAAWDAGDCDPAMVSACKARISRGALSTVRTTVQLHGAIGYTDEHDIGLYFKRAVSLAAKFGNEICHIDSFSALTACEHARRS